jgi:hypothetical protein
MKFLSLSVRGMGIASIALLGCVAHAGPEVYFGADQFPPVLSNSAPARSDFLDRMVLGVGSEGFENQTVGSVGPLQLTFPGSMGDITATLTTLTGTGRITDSSGAGDFNTTPGGNNWWQTDNGNFEIAFSKPISSFGFYGTDIGDASGQVTLTLTDVHDLVTSLTIPNPTFAYNGAQIFYGFVDLANSYKSIVFGNTSAGGDNFGFDDMVIGDAGQLKSPPVLPLPGTLALATLALLAAASVRRRV